MRWGDDTEEAFPPRHPREPGGLRQDILDEIADHLACAAEREADRGGENDNEETVWGRVLERFGNPDAIARKLWWDEMRDTVMREWIQTGVMVAVAVAVVVFMALVTRQMATANQAVLEALKSNATAVNPLVTLKVKVTRGTEDGPAAEGVRVILNGAAFGGESAFVSRSADATGKVQFGPMQPGQYRIYSFDPKSGLTSDSRTETLFAGEIDSQISMVAPDAQLVPTKLAFDSPFTLPGNCVLQLWIESTWGNGEATWNRRIEALTDGTRWWTRYTDPSGDEQPPSLSDVDSQGVVINATWKDVLVEGGALRMSGEVVEIRAALLEDEEGHRLRRVLHEELANSAFLPNAEGSGYQLTLPESFKRYVVEKHAAARGLELDEGLWSALRTDYPDFMVDMVERAQETEEGILVENQLYRLADASREAEIFATSAKFGHISGDGKPSFDYRTIGLIRTPAGGALKGSAAGRVLLALYFESGVYDEFENSLQAWSLPNDVLNSEWPTFPPDPSQEPVVLDLGGQPIAELSNEGVANMLKRSGWLLFDVTAAFSPEGGASAVGGVMLRWSQEAIGFHNRVAMVSAAAKLETNESRRPMWLLLKPMAAEVAAAQ